jgi:hypothetical protein
MANNSRYFNDPIPQLYIPTSTASAENQQGIFGNMVDKFQGDGLSALGGMFDMVGAEGIAKQFYGWSEEQYQQMSDAGREAMSRQFFEEDEDGNIRIGEGLTSLDTWLLTMAGVAGQFAATAIPGAGAAGAVARAASLGSKGRAAANVVGMGATGGAAATGQGMEQAREEVRNMPDELLADSAIFRDLYLGIDASKPDWNEEQKWDAAKEALAAQVAREVQTDPVALAANFGASAIGDPIIGRALTGARLAKNGAFRSAVRGALIEGSTEAVQAGTQQYSINQALQPIDNRDSMDGVGIAALNEGLAGAGFGGVAGGFGGVANRQPKDRPAQAQETGSLISPGSAPVVNPDPSMQLPPEMEAELNRGLDPAVAAVAEQNPTLGAELNALDQASASRQRDVAQALNRQRDLDMPTAARNAGFANSPQDVGRFGDMLTSPVQRSIAELDEMRARTVADMVAMATQDKSPTPQDRFSPIQYQFEGEVIPAASRQPASLLEGLMVDGEQAQFLPDNRMDGEYFQGIQTEPQQPKLPQKDIIFSGDNRPAQQAQERSQELERMANTFADNARNQPARIPQKDIIFAGNETGVTVKQNGQPFQSPKEALASKTAREAKKAGNQIEAVPFADGYGWQVVAPNISEQAPNISQATDTNVGTTISDQAAVMQSPETDTAPQAAQEAQAMPAIRGTKARTYTPASNKPIDVEYRVVEADSLVTSNDFAGAVNPNYPAEMQPRNRSRQAYQLQVNNIAKNPIAEKLLDSPDTDRGAPVVRNGIVESGNGRSIGLREAYRTGRGDAYKQALIARAEQLGLDPEQVANMQQPVLVRERLTELSPAELREFTVDSNQSAGVEQSPAELAKTDAAMIDDALITQLAIPEDGDVLAPMNSRFLRGFAAKLGNNELGSYMTSDGQWNKAFKDRVQNAIFAKGYDDAEMLSRISESTNPESKNLLSALMSVAGKLGAIRALDADIGSSLSDAYTQAAGLLSRAKREGTTVDAINAQVDMLTGHTDADIVALAESLESMIRSSKKMTALLDGIASSVLTDARNMGQTDIFTGEPGARPNVNEVIRNAARQQQQPDNAGTPGLFDSPQNQEADSTEQPSIPQATEPSRAESQSSEVSQQAEPTNQTPADAGVSVSEDAESETASADPSAPIEDFGEKIGGARKDVWGGFSDAINSDASTAELPLSKSFPEPDYVKMAADGVPMETLALIAAMRAEIPTKPRDAYKVRRWAEKVDVLRGFASDLISGDVPLENVLAAMRKSSGEMAAIAEAVPAIAKANPETLKLAAKYRLDSGAFTMFKGQEYRPAKVFYFPKNGRTEVLDLASDNKQAALDNLSALIEAEANANKDTPGTKQSKIDVYQNRYTKQVYLGWKGGSGVLKIQDFPSVNAARDYLKNNRAEVEAKLERIKETPGMRRAENRDRIGPPRFAGNVTPAIFADTFGFRGVEFGNWVEQGRRQKDLNEAYDALMDLAEVLGIPPKAIALNGELGMAFGARGKGGKRSFKAHYERDYVVINMTKEKGAGSLAHEWWHAVDNYFARMVGKPASFATDGSGVRGSDMRPEVRSAFDGVMSAIRKSGLIQRSAKLDERRSKPYWSTTQEASARSFEAFIIAELEAKGFSNDYLANIIEPEAWNALEEMQGNLPDQTYPYPTKAEQSGINPAYRNLFDTLQTKETDKGVMLFSKANTQGNKPSKGVPVSVAQREADKFVASLSGAAGIKVQVLPTQQDAEKLWRMSLDGDFVRGAYSDKTGTVYIIAENARNMTDLRQTIAHELFAHGGLDKVIGADKKQEFLNRLKGTRGKKEFKGLWSQIDRDYDGMSEDVKAEELFAYFVQNQPQKGPVKFWWNAFKRWLNNILANLGITSKGDPDVDLMQSMMESIMFGFQFGRQADSNAEGDMAFSSEGNNRFVITEQEALEQGYDVDNSFYSGTYGDPVSNIQRGPIGSLMNNVFDGIFALQDASAAKAYGDRVQRFVIKNETIADNTRLDNEKAKAYLKDYWSNDGLTDQEFDALYDAVVFDNELAYDGESTELLSKATSRSEPGEQSWEMQRVRGQLARHLGFDAVYMNDENGQSVLLVGDGVRRIANDGELKFSRTKGQPDNRTAREKIGQAQVASQTISDRIKNTVDTIKDSSWWKAVGTRATEGIFDGLHGIKKAEEAAGITDPNKMGYVSARLATGLGDMLHALFSQGALEWKGGVTSIKKDTKGLLEVFGMLPEGDGLNNWLAWMAANRAEKLMAEGRENNLTTKDIAELKALAKGNEALFEEVRKEYNKINSATLDLAEQAGLISAEQRAGFDEEWYVPFFREMDIADPDLNDVVKAIKAPFTTKTGIVGQSANIKALIGGTQSTQDLLQNIIQRQVSMIDAAVKNNAAREVAGNLDGTGFMTREDSPEFDAAVEALGLTRNELATKHQKVRIMENGKPVYFYVHDAALLRGLMQVHDVGSKALFNKMARSAKRFLTTGVTLSPDFIIRNFIRDAAHAWMVNKDGAKLGTDTWKGLKASWQGDPNYWKLIASGAAFQGGYIHGADPEAAQQQIRRALRAKGMTTAQVDGYMASIVTSKDKLMQAFEKYRQASDKLENSNRMTVYERAIAAGKSERQALFESKDLMDYSLKGNFGLMGTLIDMLPFFNARLQGLYKLGRAAAADGDDRVLKVLSRDLAMKGLKVAGFSAALAWMYGDDERYKQLAEWDKDAHWHFFLGEGTDGHIRIPKPFELGIIFGTLPERLFNFGAGNQSGKDAREAVGHAVFNTLALNPVPQLVMPVYEVLRNKSSFTGAPIETLADQQREKADRYDERTSDVTRALGGASALAGLSPKQVEHLVTGYTGTLGGYVLGMADFLARVMTGREKASTPAADWPIVRTLYQGGKEQRNTMYQQRFIESLEKAREAYGSYKLAIDEQDPDRAQRQFEKRAKELNARLPLERVQRRVSDINKAMRTVERDTRLSSSEKKDRLQQLQRQKNELYEQAYMRLELRNW